MDYLYSKILGNYLKKNYNNWYSRVPEKSFSFEGGARYCITRGPMLEINYVLTNFCVFSDAQGYSFSLRF